MLDIRTAKLTWSNNASCVWEQQTIAGFHALARGRRSEASVCWSKAFDHARSFAACDPRLATANNNKGIVDLLDDKPQSALTRFDEAQALWLAAMTWVEEMEVAIAGRGSVFHYQLAAHHGDAFAGIRRRHYRSLHAAVVAVTAFNARVTSHRLSAVHDTSRAVEDVIEKLERAFGPGLPEINVARKKEPLTLTAGGALSAARNRREVAETRSIFERWCEAPKAAPHNCLCFLAAVHLNALVDCTVLFE